MEVIMGVCPSLKVVKSWAREVGMVLLGRATSRWQTNIPRDMYMHLVPHANQVTHPGM